MGVLVRSIEPQGCCDEPKDRRLTGPIESSAAFTDRNATHRAERSIE